MGSSVQIASCGLTSPTHYPIDVQVNWQDITSGVRFSPYPRYAFPLMSTAQRDIYQRDGELVKASAAISISNKISLVERKTWNVLLQHAYDELPVKETHAIQTRRLIKAVGLNTNNIAYLKECLDNLVGAKVEWNILSKDRHEEWGVAALLADAKISKGTISYSFAPQLRHRLHNPRVFARFQLSMQKRFVCKYALPLYEVLVDYTWSETGAIEVPRMSVGTFRSLLGVEEGLYENSFSDLRRRVIEPAVDEVNEKSEIRVVCNLQKTGRRYTHVKLRGYLESALLPT